MPPGIEGTVVDARVFSRKGTEKDGGKSIEGEDILRLQRDLEEEIRIVKEDKFRKIRHLLADQKVFRGCKRL